MGLIAISDALLADQPQALSAKDDPTISPILHQFIADRENDAAPSSPQPLSGAHSRSQSKPAGVPGAKDGPRADNSDATRGTHDPVRFDSDGNVQVYIHLENTVDETLQQIRKPGAIVEIVNSDWNVLQAWVPVHALDSVSALRGVRKITSPDYGVYNTGSVTTEGDAVHNADLVRAFSGLTGTDVKIGVISNGVDSWDTALASGDLPGDLEINPNSEGFGHEGTAMLEIVHDLAPGAQLAFSGGITSLAFVESVLWLANGTFSGEGADIIVDDVGFFREPYFEDGLVADVASEAVAGGTVFLSAAGNFAESHYEADFVDGGGGFHAFGGNGDIALRVEGHGRMTVNLHWNDQVGASGNDYDLYVCRADLRPVKFNLQNRFCAAGTGIQDGYDDPNEEVFFVHDGYVDVFVRKDKGDDRRLELFVRGGTDLEYGAPEGSIFRHAAVEKVLAVGAVNAADPGNDDLQPFSARGRSEIYFPSRETRYKPDVVGTDGGRVTGSGAFGVPAEEVPGSLFFGTSAAAPHVAGIAGLVMQAQRLARPEMTKVEVADAVRRILRETAVDLGEQDANGYSELFGYGRADALAAVESVASSPTTFGAVSMDPFPDVFTVDSTGDGADASTGDNDCDDGSGSCTLRAAIQEANLGDEAVIKFDIAGAGTRSIRPNSPLPTVNKPVFIDGFSQPGAGLGELLIELDGANAGTDADGMTIGSGPCYVRGLAVNGFEGNGIVLQSGIGGCVIFGNHIGTGTGGAADKGNGAAGVLVRDTQDAVLLNNVVSGNDSNGVNISGGDSGGAVIQDNVIGLTSDQTAGLGNGTAGVHVSGAPDVVLRGNTISGNGSHGLSLAGTGATNAHITNNLIGVDGSGSGELGNAGSGVHIVGVHGLRVFDNVISANDSHGIGLAGSGTYDADIRENYIGTNHGGADIGNSGSGIHIGDSSSDHSIEFNTIACNSGDGVTVVSPGSSGNSIRKNSIFSNDDLGIDLSDDGATANDFQDLDSGPNFLQNFPADLIFTSRDDAVSARFVLEAPHNHEFIMDYYSCDTPGNGEGKVWLGSALVMGVSLFGFKYTVSTYGDSIVDFTAPTGAYITATATSEELNSTSEFASCTSHVDLPALDISVATVDATEDSDTAATYTVRLPSAPEEETNVSLSIDDTSAAGVSPSVLTFAAGDNSAQTVTVTPVSDADAIDTGTSILHEVDIDSNGYPTARLPVIVTDDELATVSLTSTTEGITFPEDVSVCVVYDGILEVNEGETATYEVRLDAEPDGDLTLNLKSTVASALTLSKDTTDPKEFSATVSLTFERESWEDMQTVTVNAESDDDFFDELATIEHPAQIGGSEYILGQLKATIVESTWTGLSFSAETREVQIPSDGGSATYTIVPDSEPSADLTVHLASVIPDELSITSSQKVTVSPASMTFTVGTDANWDTPQTVTVTGVADDDEFDDQAHIQHSTTIYGEEYHWEKVLVTVKDGNRAPYLEQGLSTTREVAENAGPNTHVGAPVTGTDLNGDILNYSLDDPEGKFDIASTTGQITVSDADSPDYEDEAEYLVRVTATDPGGLTDDIEVEVLLTDVDEAPVITGQVSPTFNENATGHVALYTAVDPEQAPITWSLSGPESSGFSIDSSGNLSIDVAANFEAKSTYSFTVIAGNGNASPNLSPSGELAITLIVNDVDEPPVISGNTTVVNYPENSSGVVAAYSAADPEGNTMFTWSLYGTDSGDFEISETGVLSFKNPPDYELQADSNGNNVYLITVRAYDGNLTGSLDVAVSVGNRNDPPVISGEAQTTFNENATGHIGRYTAHDSEQDHITWSLSGPDSGSFSIDQGGNLSIDGIAASRMTWPAELSSLQHTWVLWAE